MKKEEKTSKKCPICGRLTHKESKYCIFHASAEEKTEKEFKEAMGKYIEKIKENNLDYNFTKFIFIGDIDFERDFKVNTFKNANFWEAILKGDAIFKGATFKGVANFRWTTFEREVNFHMAVFEGYAFFRKANFKSHADFSKATFKGVAAFLESTFKGLANFYGSTFKRSTNFILTNFEGVAYFSKATFKGVAAFNQVSFKDADFALKYFIEHLSFSRIKVFPGKKLSIKLNNDGGKISFDRAYLENVYLNVELNEGILIDFTDTLLRNTYIQREQIENHILQEKKEEYLKANKIFLLLKNNFHSIGQYKDESWAFKKEKDMERKSNCHFKTLHKWLWSCFLNGIFGYGEQPGKVIVSAILVILLFASLFMIFGISNVGIEFNTSNNFLDCMYFSTITFTTLGYGDFRPLEGWGRILAGSEAFIGAFMMALFVYTFARRTGGR